MTDQNLHKAIILKSDIHQLDELLKAPFFCVSGGGLCGSTTFMSGEITLPYENIKQAIRARRDYLQSEYDAL